MSLAALTSPLAAIGASVLGALAFLGRVTLFALETVSHLFRPPFYAREFTHALVQIGWLSLPVVGLTALFTGGALALQIYAGGARFNAESVVPSIVAIGMARELGPVLGGLMVAARVASSIAAEIGTMKVTEQIDALVTLSTHPMKYLTLPRVLAATLAVPVLVGVGDAIGIMGGYLVGISRLDFNAAAYLKNTVDFLEAWDVISGPDQGRGLRLHRRHHGLFLRYAFRTRGSGRRQGDQIRRCRRVGPDPGLQLYPDRTVLLGMTTSGRHNPIGAQDARRRRARGRYRAGSARFMPAQSAVRSGVARTSPNRRRIGVAGTTRPGLRPLLSAGPKLDPARTGSVMITLSDVHKAFGSNKVLRGVNLTIPRGQSMVIIGGSGTGKSVALKCVLGLITPDTGQITVDGADVNSGDRDAFLARFGMLFQGGALFDSLPVWQNVAFRLLRGSLKRPRDEAREIAIEKLRRVGLNPETADLFPAELSGGMQKRVGLARAIAAEPEIIFFDEPTTGLDPIMSGVINDLIREIVVEMGATAMTITHDMSSVRAIADKVAMLHDGVIQWTGPVSDMDASGDPYLDQFIHGSAEGPIEAVR